MLTFPSMLTFLYRRRLQPARLLLAVLSLSLSLAVPGAAQSSGAPSPSSASAPGQVVPRQQGTPLPLTPDPPGLHRNHRLILKDGTYQFVTQYKIVGDRVQYFSQERSDWEEIPSNLVDWNATRQWESEHAAPDQDNASEGMKEAAAVDKEELDARNEQKARTPTVAPGLDLPDDNGAFALDTFQGTRELVKFTETDIAVDHRKGHGLGILKPGAGWNAEEELDGRHARIHLHVNDPAIYLSLPNPDDNTPVTGHAIMVKTDGAQAVNGRQGAHAVHSRFVVVKVDERNAVRIVEAVRISPDGVIAPSENVLPVRSEVLPGSHWVRVQPERPLDIGEYALIEILPSAEISPGVWDFRVDPTKGDNPGALTPILEPVDARR